MMHAPISVVVMSDFFVSYNQADQSWAEWIAFQLEGAGYSTTIQAWDFRPGSNFVLDMQRAATESERVIAVLSPSYLMARFTQPEWAVAFARDPTGAQGTLLPVRVQECNLEGLLPQIVYIDLVNLDEATARTTLLAGLRRARAKPTAVAFPDVLQPVVAAPQFPRPTRQDSFSLPRLSPEDQNDRRSMLRRVRQQVQQQLEESLQGAAWIALGLEHRPDAVPDRQARLLWEHARSAAVPLSTRDITDAFGAFEGELLILGAPGAGKTTALLDLAQGLAERAEHDERLQMPLVFNLASWGTGRLALDDWLASELSSSSYQVPRRMARAWVDGNQILPLLDGLDEVAPEHRSACVDAINAFRAKRGRRSPRLVVCCRLTEYEELPHLRLQGAIVVQPLTEEQVDTHLATMGRQLAGLRSALRDDGALRQLARSPLLLNIMILTYQGVPSQSLPMNGTLDDRLSLVFTDYVERMFTRQQQEIRAPYPPEQTVHWLAWLARTLSQQSEATFYLEDLQPNWLPSLRACRRYVLVDRLGLGLLVGLLVGLSFGLFIKPDVALIIGLSIGLVFGLAGGRGKTSANPSQSTQQLGALLPNAAKGLLVGPPAGLAAGLLVGLTKEQPNGLVFGLLFGLLVGLLVGLPFAFASMLIGGPSIHPRRVATVEIIRWSSSRAVKSGVAGLSFGLIGGLLVGLPTGLFGGRIFGLTFGLIFGLIAGLGFGLIFGLIAGLSFGLLGGSTSGGTVTRTVPNQGIHRSACRAIVFGLFGGLIVGLIVGLSFGLIVGLIVDLPSGLFGGRIFGLIAGLSFGLLGGLAYGGQACLSHLTLRFVLWQEGAMPLNYVHFLEYATDRIFLRRVGGGYIFVHRLVQEHFAANETVLIKRVSESARLGTRSR